MIRPALLRTSLIASLTASLSVLVACAAPDDLLAERSTEAAPVGSLSDAVMASAGAGHLPADMTAGEASGVRWSLPAGWEATTPSSSMRLAQWTVPGVEGSEPAECALFMFPGGGGGVEANVARWLGQFEQPDGAPSAERAERMTMTVAGVPTTLLQVTGVFLSQNPPMTGPIDPRPDHALFAAIYETAGAPHFLKCVGPRQTVGERAVELSTFVMSFRFDA